MSAIKVVLYTSKTLKNGEHPIMLRVIKDRKSKYIGLGHSCSKAMWDDEKNLPKKNHPLFGEIMILIDEKKMAANKLVLNMDIDGKDYSAEEIQNKLKRQTNKMTVFSFFDLHIQRLKDAGRIGNAKVYQSTKNSLSKFRDEKDFQFSDISTSFLNRYEESFLKRNVCLNGIFVHLRTFKTLCNFAKVDGVVRDDYNPFKDFSFKKYRNIVTKKRAISREEMKQIEDLKIEVGSNAFHARNYFVFSFYCRGMNFIDMAFLKWSDINDNRIDYNRKKTHKYQSIGLLEPALAILGYYHKHHFTGSDSYVFPILKPQHNTPQSIENRTDKVLRMVNSALKEIGIELGIKDKLTTYVARHSYATVMKRQGASLAHISESLGHQNERITQVYLDSFGNDVLDEANRLIL